MKGNLKHVLLQKASLVLILLSIIATLGMALYDLLA